MVSKRYHTGIIRASQLPSLRYEEGVINPPSDVRVRVFVSRSVGASLIGTNKEAVGSFFVSLVEARLSMSKALVEMVVWR